MLLILSKYFCPGIILIFLFCELQAHSPRPFPSKRTTILRWCRRHHRNWIVYHDIRIKKMLSFTPLAVYYCLILRTCLFDWTRVNDVCSLFFAPSWVVTKPLLLTLLLATRVEWVATMEVKRNHARVNSNPLPVGILILHHPPTSIINHHLAVMAE